MKLTCTCGASIEVEEIDPDRCSPDEFERRRASRRNNLNMFNAEHAPCIRAWCEAIRTWPRCERVKDRVIPHVPISTFMPVHDSNLCQKCGGVKPEYQRHPGYLTHRCTCQPPGPYARFRAAVKEGKRIYYLDPYGRMSNTASPEIGFFPAKPECYFIEGVDIPPQPTRDWLDKHGVELTGECRRPMHKDLWHGMSGKLWGPGEGNVASIGDFSGRRWIVKRKDDDGFEKWFTDSREACILSKDGLKGMAHYIWTAAQEAAKK